MSPDLENALYSAWPEVFGNGNRTPGAFAMSWGFECDDGWAALIDAVCEVTTSHASSGAHRVLAAIQVKQKVGSLRVYFDDYCEFCDGARLMAEAYSAFVCEVSGAPGHRVGVNGVKTLSSKIAEQFGFSGDMPESPVRVVQGVPPGWHNLSSALIDRAAWLQPGTALQFRRGEDDRLAVVTDCADVALRGAIASAVALSRRTDPLTGVVRFEPPWRIR